MIGKSPNSASTSPAARPATPPAIYAHTLPPPKTRADWEPLDRHLAEVANLAREFASVFGAEDWGDLLGHWHDLGKRSEKFPGYISDATRRVSMPNGLGGGQSYLNAPHPGRGF